MEKERRIKAMSRKCLDMVTSGKKDDDTINEVNSNAQEMMRLKDDITKLKESILTYKTLELCIETVCQVSLTLTFLAMTASRTATSKSFNSWFISNQKSLLIAFFLSLRSVLNSQLKLESMRVGGSLKSKGKFLICLVGSSSSLPRIFGIVSFWAVPLGLFNLLGHFTLQRDALPFAQEIQNSYQGVIEMADLSSENAKYTDYTFGTFGGYFLLMVAMFIALLSTITIVLMFTRRSFRKMERIPKKIAHILTSTLTITVWNDLDDAVKEMTKGLSSSDLKTLYAKAWTKEHREYTWKLIFHTIFNVLLTLPLILLYRTVSERHALLQRTTGTHQMEDYSFALVKTGSWLLPLCMMVSGLVNYALYRLYIKFGHPFWSRFLKDEEERKDEWKSRADIETEMKQITLRSKNNSINEAKASDDISNSPNFDKADDPNDKEAAADIKSGVPRKRNGCSSWCCMKGMISHKYKLLQNLNFSRCGR